MRKLIGLSLALLTAGFICLGQSRGQIFTPKVPQFMAAADVWGTVFTSSLTTSDAGSNLTFGFIFNNSLLTAPSGVPTKIRATYKAGSATWPSSAATVCNQVTANACDCVATPITVLFTGSASFSILTTASLLSDEMTFSWDKTKGICFKTYNSGTQTVATNTSVTGAYNRFTASSDVTAGTTNLTSLNQSNRAYGITKIETNGF
jgi:hypothetical protein